MNSMQREISADSLANEIRMYRSSDRIQGVSRCFLMVEGQNDAALFKKFVSENDCLLLIGFCRANVFGAILLLDDDGFCGALGVIDQDYLSYFPDPDRSDNIVYTDENDMEMMILVSPTLENFLEEYGSSDKIRRAEANAGRSARDLILAAGAQVGALRVVSRREKLALKMHGMDLCYTTASLLKIDLEEQCRLAISRTKKLRGVTVEELCCKVGEVIKAADEPRTLCCGHDCVRILGHAVRRCFGSTSQFDSARRSIHLGKTLRLAYERHFFERTQLYLHIRNWEQRNGARIFS